MGEAQWFKCIWFGLGLWSVRVRPWAIQVERNESGHIVFGIGLAEMIAA